MRLPTLTPRRFPAGVDLETSSWWAGPAAGHPHGSGFPANILPDAHVEKNLTSRTVNFWPSRPSTGNRLAQDAISQGENSTMKYFALVVTFAALAPSLVYSVGPTVFRLPHTRECSQFRRVGRSLDKRPGVQSRQTENESGGHRSCASSGRTFRDSSGKC